MIAVDESDKETSYTIVKGDCDNTPIVASDDENPCSSTNDQREDVTKKIDHDGKLTKVRVDTSLLRQTTASIADTLLKLGGSKDDCDTSSCNYSGKNRKRYISIDASSAGTQSIDSETDIPSTVITKRQRKTPSQALCSVPTSVCPLTRPESSLHENGQFLKFNILGGDSEEQAFTSSTSGLFQIEHRNVNDKKIPGEIGCISQSFQSFRPLAAAPQLPRGIIAESPPPMPLMQPPFLPLSPSANMNSFAISEHDDFLSMHSYAVIPKTVPHHMVRIQLPTGN